MTRQSHADPGHQRAHGDRLVLVHDYLLVFRGAERTFAAMAGCWPDAPVATLVYDRSVTDRHFAGHEIRPSWLQRLRPKQQNFRRLLPLYPGAARRLPVSDAAVVVSSSSAFAHGVRPDPAAMHVCYCHSPFRYVWHESEYALEETPPPLRPAMRLLQLRLRGWDRESTTGVTQYLANSRLTQQRIFDFWGRESLVLHPPVAVERFSPAPAEDYFLVLGELVRYKRVGLALAAARRTGRPVKVVGTGPELEVLRAAYGDHAEFRGRVSDAEIESLLARCRALVVPNVEDFGIAAVEAQAAGRPVVAPRGGGHLETVIEGETGVLFPPGDEDALAEILRSTDFDRFSPSRMVAHAGTFSTERFQARLREILDSLLAQHHPRSGSTAGAK